MEETFRNQQMIQITDVGGRIRFIQEILGKYKFPEGQKKQAENEILQIQKCQKDPTLHMAVVGEFSSGKSSFINALLREELLETDVLQGTTVTSTLLRYSPQKTLSLCDAQGNKTELQNMEGQGGLRALLKAYTSGGQGSGPLGSLEVGHPSDFLEQGICILDTPGTNSLETWHEEVTKKTLRERTDACIVLTSADKPFPQTLCRFLEENLEDVLSTCIFVVTKMDLIPEKQQAGLLSYIERSVKDAFSVSAPLVLPYSSVHVLSAAGTPMLRQSRDTEAKILQFLKEQRVKIQLQRCISLLEYTMAGLRENMVQISTKQEERHARLLAAVTTDLDSFVLQKKAEGKRRFTEKSGFESRFFQEQVDRWSKKEKCSIYKKFRQPMTETQLRKFLNGQLETLLEAAKANILQKTGMGSGRLPIVFAGIRRAAQDVCAQFEMEFKEEYRQLELLTHGLIQPIDSTLRPDEKLMQNVQANLSIHKKVADNDQQETRSFYGNLGAGAAAGAAIGSIVPGIGTGVGALIGAAAGFVRWGKKTDDTSRGDAFRKQVSRDVTALVEQYFTGLNDGLMQSYTHCMEGFWGEVERVMDQYLARYTRAVNEMRQQDQQGQERATKLLHDIQMDLTRVESQAEQVQSVKLQISRL